MSGPLVTVAGGTGFVGMRLLKKLVADGRRVKCLVRGDKAAERVSALGAEPVKGDILDQSSLEAAMRGADAAINIVGIIKEDPKKGITFEKLHHEAAGNFARAAVAVKIPKIIQMSALGARPDAVSAYHRTKYAGEQEIISSGIAYTIFRPSAQIGEEGEFTAMMFDLISRAPVMPVFGSGKYMMQPMDVDDTAALFSAAVDNSASNNKIYDVGGPEEFEYVRMLDLFMEALGVKRMKIFIPAAVSNLMVSAMQILPNPPITKTQYQMLLEDNVCDNSTVNADFPGIEMRSVRPVLERAAALRKR